MIEKWYFKQKTALIITSILKDLKLKYLFVYINKQQGMHVSIYRVSCKPIPT